MVFVLFISRQSTHKCFCECERVLWVDCESESDCDTVGVGSRLRDRHHLTHYYSRPLERHGENSSGLDSHVARYRRFYGIARVVTIIAHNA